MALQFDGLAQEKYALSQLQMFWACLERELQLVDRNRPLYTVRFVQLLLLAVVTATLFLRTRMRPTSVADGNLYFGGVRPHQQAFQCSGLQPSRITTAERLRCGAVVFFSLVQLMFDGTIEMQLTVSLARPSKPYLRADKCTILLSKCWYIRDAA